MNRFLLIIVVLIASFFSAGVAEASLHTAIKFEKDATARFYLHNGQEIKYITLPKGQTYNATLEDSFWIIDVGNAKVSVREHFAKPIKEEIKAAKNTNKLQLLSQSAVAVYTNHQKKGKPIATLAKNVRISSNGVKGNFYEIVVGGKLGYVSVEKMEEDTGIPILIYHHLVNDIKNSTFRDNISVVDIADFEEQMTFLNRTQFTTISLKDLDLWMQKKQALPAKSVALSFDDANLSVEKMAYPILKEKDMYATSFVIGNRVKDDTPEFDSELPKVQFAGFEELRNMLDRFELEHHTYNLHNFNNVLLKGYLQLTSNKDLQMDFMMANKVFHTIDPSIKSSYFSYPYGLFNKRQESILIDNGISLAFLNKGGKAKITSPRLYVPRVPVQNSMTLDHFKSLVNN